MAPTDATLISNPALLTTLLIIGLPLAWRCLQVWLHRQAAAAEQRMASLSVYSLGEDDLSDNCRDEPRRDVDAEERAKFSYDAPRRLPNGGMLIHPTAASETCVLYIPGFGRCFDHYRFDDLFRSTLNASLVGLDLRRYGRSYLADKAVDGRSCHFNLVDEPRRGLAEYFADVDDARAALGAMGVRRVVLWGNSTGGLMVASYLAAQPPTASHPVAAGAPGAPAAVIAAVLDSPLLQFCRGKLPFPSFLEPAVALILSLVPALVVQTDDALGEEARVPSRPSWLDELATRYRPSHRYDRHLNPVRAKPTYAGYLAAVLIAMGNIARDYPPKAGGEGGGGAGGGASGAPPLAVPAMLLLTAKDVGMAGCEGFKPHGGPGVDQHIDTDAVEAIFARVFARGATLRRDDLLHEALMSEASVVEQVLAALAWLLLTQA